MLEYPSIPHYSCMVTASKEVEAMCSENVTGGDNQQETALLRPTLDTSWVGLEVVLAGSSETARQAAPIVELKIQSDLHGDMQS